MTTATANLTEAVNNPEVAVEVYNLGGRTYIRLTGPDGHEVNFLVKEVELVTADELPSQEFTPDPELMPQPMCPIYGQPRYSCVCLACTLWMDENRNVPTFSVLVSPEDYDDEVVAFLEDCEANHPAHV